MANILDRLDEMNESGVIAYDIYSELHDLASLLEERKVGRWEIKKASIHPYGNDVACSECGFTMGSSFGYKFCPMCGCKMKSEGQE